MIVELEFLDHTKCRYHEEIMEYTDCFVPIPNVGDRVYVEGKFLVVEKRDFIYLKGGGGGGIPDMKVSLWCRERRNGD